MSLDQPKLLVDRPGNLGEDIAGYLVAEMSGLVDSSPHGFTEPSQRRRQGVHVILAVCNGERIFRQR